MTKRAMVGIVSTHEQAEHVVNELTRAGFAHSDISVLFPDKQATKEFVYEKHTKAPEGATAGVSAGGVVGGTLGLLVGIGALAIPGAGPFIAAGPIMAALSGAAAGATVGGIAGALIGLGIPEIEAKQYEAKVRGGGILISVHVPDGEARGTARQVLARCGATDVMALTEDEVGPAAKRAGGMR